MSEKTDILCILNFGRFGKFGVRLSITEQQLYEIRNNRFKDRSIEDMIQQLGIEYVVGLRSVIEQTNENYSYENIEYVNVAGMKIDGKELRKFIAQKEEKLLKLRGIT